MQKWYKCIFPKNYINKEKLQIFVNRFSEHRDFYTNVEFYNFLKLKISSPFLWIIVENNIFRTVDSDFSQPFDIA